MTANIGRKNGRIAGWLAAVSIGMVGLAYASSPLYDLFCRTTGFGGTPVVAQPGEVKPLVDAKKIRVLAVAHPQRHPDFPDAPTSREVGFGEPADYLRTGLERMAALCGLLIAHC